MSVALAKMEGVKGITAEIDDDGNIVGGARERWKGSDEQSCPDFRKA